MPRKTAQLVKVFICQIPSENAIGERGNFVYRSQLVSEPSVRLKYRGCSYKVSFLLESSRITPATLNGLKGRREHKARHQGSFIAILAVKRKADQICGLGCRISDSARNGTGFRAAAQTASGDGETLVY